MEAPTCLRCGAAMVQRRNRATREAFLGCSRYPACRETRPLPSVETGASPSSRPESQPRAASSRSAPGASPRRRRPRLSHGGRPSGWSDDVELIVARLVGRDLGRFEGCVVQLVAILIVAALLWWLFASGTIWALIKPFVDWYVSQIHLGGIASPTP